MFWSGNYIVGRELNFLLKEENVTLAQVLEADDILQECKAGNKTLIQFLTKPEVLAELITLITEEPSHAVELTSQYKHANVACEVLTSQLAMLSDRLSLDVAQMNRLCDFIARDPPLNPLLASYFSKTVEMLLERSPKQDWYLYHIVCLRVLDFFKSRRDFLPNLLRHISTSAIADTFKYFIRLDDLFKKTVMEWLDEHQFLDCLIQIICGTYVHEEYHPVVQTNSKPEQTEKGEQEQSEKVDANHTDATKEGQGRSDAEGDQEMESPAEGGPAAAARRAERIAGVASANAAALLCDLIVSGCAGDGCSTRGRASWSLVARLQAEGTAAALLRGIFTSPPRARRHALVNGCHVLRAMLAHDPALRACQSGGAEADAEAEAGRSGAELAVAPHLPLLHQALLQRHHAPHEECGGAGGAGGVGLARLQVATLLAHLAMSDVEEVATTMLTLGTPGVLVDMFFEYPNNNFLHAQLLALVRHALANRVYRMHYARHLLIECDLLTRLMDAYEENKKCGGARAGHMGHAVALLARLHAELGEGGEGEGEAARGELAAALPAALLAAWDAFVAAELRHVLHHHDTPLGGYYPSENVYEVEDISDTLAANFDFNDMAATATMDDLTANINADDANEMCGAGGAGYADFAADGLGADEEDVMGTVASKFLELVSQRFDDDMWEERPAGGAADDAPAQPSPWESSPDAGAGAGGAGGAGAGWAQFGACSFAAPADPFAAAAHDQDFSPFWGYTDTDDDTNTDADAHAHVAGTEQDERARESVEAGLRALRLEEGDCAGSVELANNLLTAMSAMTPDAIANIVNANLPPDQPPVRPPHRPPGRPPRRDHQDNLRDRRADHGQPDADADTHADTAADTDTDTAADTDADSRPAASDSREPQPAPAAGER